MTPISETTAIANDINQCLSNHSLAYSPTFDFNDFLTTDNIITNHLATSKLSDLILKNYFPQNPITDYHHFTDLQAFANILATKKLWLFSVKKRFAENEFKPFYEAHHMDGYALKKNRSGVPLEEELVANAFYTSFTNDNLSGQDEDYMWRYFAKTTGVRLVFEVTDVFTDLRKVYYPPSAMVTDLPLLTDIIEIGKKRNKHVIVKRAATIGFFYLPHNYKMEQEYRLLIKREMGRYYNLSFGSKDGFEYLELPFNAASGVAKFQLKKIIFDTNTDTKKAKQIITANTDFTHIPVENNNR